MTTMQQFTQGLGEAWEHLLDGWRKLYHQASGALTRFKSHANERPDDTLSTGGWGVLACEVIDDDKQITVRLEAPGMDKKDFHLSVVNKRLVVNGEKQVERKHRKADYIISECAYGSFERVIPLPDEVDADQAAAKYRNGVLLVTLPKAKTRQRSKININAD